MNDLAGTPIESLRAPVPAVTSAAGSAELERSIAEVQAAMVIAKRFPRDEDRAFAKVLKACKRPGLAEAALYAYTKGGTEVSGPSIRLAEELARDWGNLSYGWKILSQDDEASEVRAEAWDLETNVPSHITFTVRHEFKAQGKIKKVTDPREVYELIANQASRRLRACILRVIPGDVQDAAVDQCERTLKDGSGKPLADRVRDMMAAFLNEQGVTKETVEKRIGKKIEAINETEFLALARIFVSLRDGMAKVEQFFEAPSEGPAGQPTAKDLQRPAQPQQAEAPARKEKPAATTDAGQQGALQPAAKFAAAAPGAMTVIDALSLVNKGQFSEARDLARNFSEADKKKVEAAIAARGGTSAPAAQPTPKAEPDRPGPSQLAERDEVTLTDVLTEIDDSKSEEDLTAAGTLIDELPPEDQDVARRKWMKRKTELAPKAQSARRSGRNLE